MFVELSPQVLVDPTEVAAVTNSDTGGTRIYMRGSGTRSYIEVAVPLTEVASALLKQKPYRLARQLPTPAELLDGGIVPGRGAV